MIAKHIFFQHPVAVRMVHYGKVLIGLLRIALLSQLGKRPCKAILGPILAKMRRRPAAGHGRILVTQYGLGLGDTIAFLPILRVLLSANLNPSPIIIMPVRSRQMVNRFLGNVSQIVFYDAGLGWWDAWRFFRKFREQGISLVLDFTFDTRLWQREAFFHLFTGDRVAGFLVDDGIRNYYDDVVRADRKTYIIKRYLHLLERHTGIKVDRTLWDEFPLSPAEQERIDRFFLHYGVVGKKMTAIFPTTGRFQNGVDLANWPYFGDLIERLCQSSSSDDEVIVLFGERKHQEYLESLIPPNGAGRVVCACDFGVSEVARMIQQATCVVTTNSGFLHIACNLHVPTVLFPTSRSYIWVPDNGYAHQVFCEKCARRQSCTARPPLQRNCYRKITVDRVLDRMREVQRDIVVAGPSVSGIPHFQHQMEMS